MSEFIPKNYLETELQAAHADRSKFNEFLKTFVRSHVFVPSATDISIDPGSFQPVLLDKNGERRMVVFTAKERAKVIAHIGTFGQELLTATLIKRMPPGTGLVVNPGLDVGFDIGAEGLKRMSDGFF